MKDMDNTHNDLVMDKARRGPSSVEGKKETFGFLLHLCLFKIRGAAAFVTNMERRMSLGSNSNEPQR
jgi:hypothetical protein